MEMYKITNINKGIDIKFNYLAKPTEFRISSEDCIEYWKKTSTRMFGVNEKGVEFPTPGATPEYSTVWSYAHRIMGEYYKINKPNEASCLYVVYKDAASNSLKKMSFYDNFNPVAVVGNYVKGIALSSIEFRGGKINFRGSEYLNKIEVFDSKNNMIKQIDFIQNYAYHHKVQEYYKLDYMSLDTEDNKEVNISNKNYKGTNYLDSIHIRGKDGLIYDKYAFEYYRKECFGNHLRNRDVWGGYNESTKVIQSGDIEISIPNIKQDFPYFLYGYSSSGNWTYLLGDNTNVTYRPEVPNEYGMQTGILKRIYYATGGYIHFDYEANRYKESVNTSSTSYYNP